MLPLTTAQSTTGQTQAPSPQPVNPDPFWAVVGQYGVGAAALLALLKAYADYQLKAAMEDRALKSKGEQQSLELEGRVFGSLLSQQESSVSSTNQLLNTFIAKTLNQAEANNEQTSSLIATIGTLTEAIKFLGETQQSQTEILHELKEYSESHGSELTTLRSLKTEILHALSSNIATTNQVLSLIESLIESMANTKANTYTTNP